MAFQIVNLCFTLQGITPFEGTFSAGGEQMVICAVYVHLEATVVGNITEHQTLWEQISGSPVVLIGDPANTLTISYQRTLSNDDRVFRFWIDKGTDDQLYSDVTIYGTVVEKIALCAAPRLFDPAVSINTVLASSVSAFPALPNYVVGSEGISIYNSPQVWVYWKFTDQPLNTLKYVEVEENSTGAWIVKARIYPSEPQFYTSGNIVATYRVNAVYQNGRVPQGFLGTPVRLSIKDNYQIVDKIVGSSVLDHVEYQRDIITRTKITYSTDYDPINLVFLSDNAVSLGATYTSRTKITLQPDSEVFYLSSIGDTKINDIVVVVIHQTRIQVGA